MTKGRLQTEGRAAKRRVLTIRAKHLIDSIRALYSGTPLVPPSGRARGTSDVARKPWTAAPADAGALDSLGPPMADHGRGDSVIGGNAGHPPARHAGQLADGAAAAWSFQHIEDLFPTAPISRGCGPVAELPPTNRDRCGDVPRDRRRHR